jgi:radical SAM protein with 4Fe4S-binding SPASM domain
MLKFKRVYLEISNICNIQCSFCPVVERDNKIMDLEEFSKALAQVSEFTDEICLHLMGEPLAHPKIKEILGLCDESGIKVMITTNGLLLKRYQELLLNSKCIRQINFSLQSYKDNFPHKELRQYLVPLMGFTTLVHAQREDMYINFRLWNYDVDQGENEEIYLELEKFYETSIKREVDVGNIKSKNIWNKVYLHFDSRFEWPDMSLPVLGDQGRCHGMVNHIGIQANGDVVPCCLDKESVINLGNIFETDLKSILFSERSVRMREGFKNGRLTEDLCKRCSFITRFSK